MIGGFVLLCGLAACGMASCSNYSCDRLGAETSLEVKWSWVNGCFVKVKGKWVPEANWRELDQ